MVVVVEVPASSAVPPAGLRKARSEVACAGSAGTRSRRAGTGGGVEGSRARRVGEQFRLGLPRSRRGCLPIFAGVRRTL